MVVCWMVVADLEKSGEVHWLEVESKGPGYREAEFSSVQSLSCLRPFATPWTEASDNLGPSFV